MTRQEHAKLRTAMRQLIDELQARGKLSTRYLTELVQERYPELIEEASTKLIREAIAKWARQMMKSEALALKSPQFAMPLEIAGIKLPQAISLPPTDDDEETMWTPIEQATFAELEAHCTYLRGTVAADTRRLESLMTLHNYLAPHMADEHADEPIGPKLAELAHKKDVV